MPGKLFVSACLLQEEKKSLPVWARSRPGAVRTDPLPNSIATLSCKKGELRVSSASVFSLRGGVTHLYMHVKVKLCDFRMAHTQRGRAAGWTAGEVCTWLESSGAAGLAPMIRASAVDGMDLLSFNDPQMLATDLRLTPFAARKLLQLRDRELAC